MFPVILAGAVSAMLMLPAAPAHAADGRAMTAYTGNIIVQWRADADADADAARRAAPAASAGASAAMPDRDAILRQVRDATGIALTLKRQMGGNRQLMGAPADAGADPEAIAAKLRLDPRIADAVPDRWLHLHDTVPNDPEFAASQQLYLGSPSLRPGAIDLPRAWDRTQGSDGVVIAILDTGILNHPDLSGRVVPGYDFISDVNVSMDGDGRDADPLDNGDNLPQGYVCPGSSTPNPTATANSWHGLRVTGVIGAATNNAQGVSGIDWRARLLPVRVSGRCGALLSDTVDGMRWAGGLPVPNVPANPTPARVINISLGGGTCTSVEQSAVNDLNARGVVVVAATGNSAGPVEAPADCAGVVAVTSHANDGENSSFANVGPQVALSAPGGGCGNSKVANGTCQTAISVIRTLHNDGTTSLGNFSLSNSAGTSFAAPMVSGVAGLMLAVNGNLSASQVATLLKNTARPHPANTYCTSPATSGVCGTGLLDANGAVSAATGTQGSGVETPATPPANSGGDGGGGHIELAGASLLLAAGLLVALRQRRLGRRPGRPV